jgi:uncharacterized membrane protein
MGVSISDFAFGQGNAWKYVAKGRCETMSSPKGKGSLKPVKM